MSARPHIGVIGCGRMGLGMARNLKQAGFNVTGHDQRPVTAFGDFSPSMVANPRDFASDRTILISVVRDEAETDAALFGAQNIIQNATQLETLIVSSTLSPQYIQTLRNQLPKPINLIDAPMSGAQAKAEDGTLSFMVGGDHVEGLMPLFNAMGANTHHLGPLGSGMTAKVLNNLVAASSTIATRTALDWAKANGLAPRALLDVMATSSGQNWLASGFDTIEFAQHGYEQGNSIAVLTKDVQCALTAAPEGADTDLPELLIAQLKALKHYES